MERERVIATDPETLGGTPVFAGTRVPVASLIAHLKAGDTLDDFLEGFPSVTREQVEAFLEMALHAAFRANCFGTSGMPGAAAARRQSYPMTEPDLLLEPEFVANPETLYEQLVSDIPWDERMRARKTANFGAAYNYSGMTYEPVPMHPLLVSIVDRLEQKLGFRPNNCLVNYYPNGDSTMGFHSDSEEEIVPGTGVAIVSLGAERRITYRSKQDKQVEHSYPLPSGSLLYMPPLLQQDWKHAILKQENTGGRISLTFRLLTSQTA